MSSVFNLKLTAVGSLLAAMAIATNAGAYVYATCNGTPVRLPFPPGTGSIYRDLCSMPTNSPAHIALAEVSERWNELNSVETAGLTYNDGCVITHGNGRSEAALVDPSVISGDNGLTILQHSGCPFAWSTNYITESDIMVRNDMNFSPEDESFFNLSNNQQGRVDFLHEWGHAIGLRHSTGLDVMTPTFPVPVTGGNGIEPYPDDAAGSRFLYGGAGFVNVFVSAQQFSGGGVQATNASGTVNVCRGQALSVTYTVSNNGTSNVTSGFRIYINTSPLGYSGGWNMFNGTATVNAQNQFTETRVLNVPSVSPGIYWVLWQVDTGNTVSEMNEFDNAVHSAMTINVQNC